MINQEVISSIQPNPVCVLPTNSSAAFGLDCVDNQKGEDKYSGSPETASVMDEWVWQMDGLEETILKNSKGDRGRDEWMFEWTVDGGEVVWITERCQIVFLGSDLIHLVKNVNGV